MNSNHINPIPLHYIRGQLDLVFSYLDHFNKKNERALEYLYALNDRVMAEIRKQDKENGNES